MSRVRLKPGYWYLVDDSGAAKVRAYGRDGRWWTPLRGGWISSPSESYVPIRRLRAVEPEGSLMDAWDEYERVLSEVPR